MSKFCNAVLVVLILLLLLVTTVSCTSARTRVPSASSPKAPATYELNIDKARITFTLADTAGSPSLWTWIRESAKVVLSKEYWAPEQIKAAFNPRSPHWAMIAMMALGLAAILSLGYFLFRLKLKSPGQRQPVCPEQRRQPPVRESPSVVETDQLARIREYVKAKL